MKIQRKLVYALWALTLNSFCFGSCPVFAATPQAIQAVHDLKVVDTVQSSRIGFTAAISPQLVQLLTLLDDPDAVQLLRELYEQGSLAGKMYAIIGLQMIGQQDLANEWLRDAQQYAALEIGVFEGCVLNTSQVSNVLERIQEGTYSESFKEVWGK